MPAPEDPSGAPQLAGTLTGHGVAEFEPANLPDHRDADKAPNGSARAPDSSSAISTSDEEDYDTRPVDHSAFVSRGAGDEQTNRMAHLERRTSIPIMLERTDTKGKYILTADESEIREIIRQGLERQASGKRKSVRDLVFTRRFTTFDPRNPSSSDSAFKGFFVLFWLAMALMLVRVAAQNYRVYGSVIGQQQMVHLMFSKDVLLLGVVDLLMALGTYEGLLLHRVILKGYVSWGRSGWIIQNLWQTFYILSIIGFAFYREWPWTHTIFVMLHGCVFLMKQHSYTFYNGYLSQVFRRKQVLQHKLNDLRSRSTPSSPVLGTASGVDAAAAATDAALRHRRRSSKQENKPASNLSYESPEIAAAANIISSGKNLSADQVDAFTDLLTHELDQLNTELRGKCIAKDNAYPKNLTFFNLTEFLFLPTLVYELEYPRQEKIDWLYVLEKAAATLGGIFIMMVISQSFIYPPVADFVALQESGLSVAESWYEFPWLVSDIMFPILFEQLLTWYVIWECLLNLLAELTMFADRGFYGDWWNSVSWDQYARDWNRPVHSFLLRHVYHSTISAFHLSRGTATFVTFFLSALVHELAMFCIFKKVRGYLFVFQLLQIPLAMLSRTPIMKSQKTLGNVLFWTGLFLGPSVIASMYIVS